ncbi:MAG: 4Fe-4S binding protein [Anaerotruncus massiliensis (ex Togo et al. 2019)]
MSPSSPLSDSERRRRPGAAGHRPRTIPHRLPLLHGLPVGRRHPRRLRSLQPRRRGRARPFDGRALRENAKAIRAIYDALPEERRAGRCVGCGRCVSHCPQGIAIPQRLGEIAALMKILE